MKVGISFSKIAYTRRPKNFAAKKGVSVKRKIQKKCMEDFEKGSGVTKKEGVNL